jgi:uncharacterized protein (TIGR02646 family)
VVQDLERALHAEQGGICAYTGIALSLGAEPGPGFHVEHLKPQRYCKPGEDVDYRNLVACWPAPNRKDGASFGAVHKGDWPSSEEGPLFVSPLDPSCGERFEFDKRGRIQAATTTDEAAVATIQRLGLDDGELTKRRRRAIRGMLNPRPDRWLTRKQMESFLTRLKSDEQALNAGGNIHLDAFCFAKRAVLSREIDRYTVSRSR